MTSSFVSELQEEKNLDLSFFAIQQRVKKRLEMEYGIPYYLLLYVAIFTTVFIVSYLNPPKFYRDIISKIFNIKFSWRGAQWKVYHFLIAILIVFGILLIFMQLISFQFSPNLNVSETYENKMYRLKYKWMLETQIWLLSLVIIEISTVYRLASIYDEISYVRERINSLVKLEQADPRDRIEYLQTKESMRYDINENIH